MDNTCRICDSSFLSESGINRHLKAHDIRVVEYYQKFFPKYDLYDKKIIIYRNRDQYFSSHFNNKENLKKWLLAQSTENQKEYCKNFLSKRKDKKKIKYTPSQVELRSILSPSIIYLNELFGSYYKTAEEIGFKNKYIYPENLKFTELKDSQDSRIYVDTREQRPLLFSRPSESKTLKFGDYAFSHASYDGKLYFERKSIGDFIGTLSLGYERFHREIEKAGEANANLIIIVEENLKNTLSFNTLPHVYKKATRITPEFVFHNVRELIQKYPFIQFLFVDGRDESARIIEKIFTTQEDLLGYDLQLCYDLKCI